MSESWAPGEKVKYRARMESWMKALDQVIGEVARAQRMKEVHPLDNVHFAELNQKKILSLLSLKSPGNDPASAQETREALTEEIEQIIDLVSLIRFRFKRYR